MEKEYKFKNSNLRFLGTKMDINGNGCYMFKFPNGRAFSIQAHNFWNGSYFRLLKKPADFFGKKYGNVIPKELEAAAVGYIVAYGSRTQKEKLKIYKK
ncbi:MAG: hypothetical protein MJ204_02680 [Bacteroidales bacterium]|nr:hypothetical protein [Bacteroidales bacterium]MCQ2605433.1 hypothetical protein [Bacteroidales bacterium]